MRRIVAVRRRMLGRSPARGRVPVPIDPLSDAAAIEAVVANQVYLSSNVAGGLLNVLQHTAGPDTGRLSSRQREILQLFAEGKTTKEIASIMNLSTRTIEWHKYRMMRMLNIQRSAELVQHAVRMKLVA